MIGRGTRRARKHMQGHIPHTHPRLLGLLRAILPIARASAHLARSRRLRISPPVQIRLQIRLQNPPQFDCKSDYNPTANPLLYSLTNMPANMTANAPADTLQICMLCCCCLPCELGRVTWRATCYIPLNTCNEMWEGACTAISYTPNTGLCICTFHLQFMS